MICCYGIETSMPINSEEGDWCRRCSFGVLNNGETIGYALGLGISSYRGLPVVRDASGKVEENRGYGAGTGPTGVTFRTNKIK
jgi:hypothetical protein